MEIDAMKYVLDQLEVATKAIEDAWDIVNDELYCSGRAVLVKDGKDAELIDEDRAYKIMDRFGYENCGFVKLGELDLVVIFKNSSKVYLDGNYYLLGNYIVMKMEEQGPPFLIDANEIGRAIEIINSHLVPFNVGSDRIEAFQL